VRGQAYDNDGDEYFVNLNSGIKTYDDPRDDVQITPSAFLMRCAACFVRACVQTLTFRLLSCNRRAICIAQALAALGRLPARVSACARLAAA